VVEIVSAPAHDCRLVPNFGAQTVWVPPKAVVTLSGELDVASAETLEGSVEALLSIRPLPEEIVINVGGISFADLVGMRVLVLSCPRLKQTGRVEVSGISPSIQRILDLANMLLPAPGGAP
jgi:anti-anti-sigma factor